MKCPACGDFGTSVVNSRSSKDGNEIRRRRTCDSCSYRFTTYEKVERSFPMVVKKDSRREPWNREKILAGLTKACEKRPISMDAIEKLVDSISEEAMATGEREISTKVIGERIMEKLSALDKVAYVRFASVYRSFKDIDEFMEEVLMLVKDRKSTPLGGNF